MKISLVVGILAASLGTVAPASWKSQGTIGSAVIGCGAVDQSTAFLAGGDNGVGAEVLKTTDGGGSWAPTNISQAFMFLDVGASKTKAGSAVVNGLFGSQFSLDGKTFKSGIGGGGQGQSVEAFGANSFGIAGAFGGKGGGVAVSTNGGISFKHFAASSLDEAHPARYGAYPSDSTWYVTAGAWPSNAHIFEERFGSKSKLHKQLSEMVQVREDLETRKLFTVTLTGEDLAGGKYGNVTEYTGAIAKTNDGGKTWTNVFEHDGDYYFNGIHCASETHCIAVAEAHNLPDPNANGAHIFTTTDGKTWTETQTDLGRGVSLMGARFVSDTEGWAAGGNLAVSVVFYYFDRKLPFALLIFFIFYRPFPKVAFGIPSMEANLGQRKSSVESARLALTAVTRITASRRA